MFTDCFFQYFIEKLKVKLKVYVAARVVVIHLIPECLHQLFINHYSNINRLYHYSVTLLKF